MTNPNLTMARAAYVATDGDCTVYRVDWTSEGVTTEMQVRVPRPTTTGQPPYQDYPAAEGIRRALEHARMAAAKMAATPDGAWAHKSFFSDEYLPSDDEISNPAVTR